ncbi:MAG: hypothetical protein D6681_12685, partial [Calditrichaeota bacterium]
RRLAKPAVDPERDMPQAEAVISFLRDLGQSDWDQVVADAQAWNRYQAARLLYRPDREPDKVQRAKKISRALYGLPWWLREAHYWRELQSGHKKGRPRGR